MHRAAYKLQDGSTLTVAQVDVLEALITLGPTSVKELAGYLLVDSSNLSRTVASLVAVDLVAREEDARDRRSVELEVTERGRRAHERIARRRHEQLRVVLAPMEPRRRELLAELLDEYIDLVELTKDDDPPS
jgi:DNA-binding MarR family transcriptional regulator